MAEPPVVEADKAHGLVGPADVILRQKLHPKIRQFIEYWRSVAPEGRLPGRQHLDPTAIPALLANLWIMDVERAETLRFRYRLIGTNVARAFAKDLTGRYLDEVHPGFESTGIHGFLSEVANTGLPSWRVGRPKFFALRDFLRLERVYLPAARDGKTVDMIFAMTIFLDRHGQEY